ncbi:polysaccharide lyase 8 family protein [Microbacterium esteraromaticum]|uniref:polysaccharide lyase 8 family protein n=1 Tax=Microbacterium esteraromaticum TaxID=57043 RepID=UPI002368F318|nr:polysaccharide lyase 8 family protein [Microbacterium esteraromaticum]WDH78317.1 polysaccharide lyase 8 family protein [Microbacterium esteraromaticum]
MHTTRRGFLQLGGTALAASLIPGLLPSSAGAAPPPLSIAGGTEALRARWVDALTSRSIITADPTGFDDAIAALDRGTTALMQQIAPTGTRYFTSTDWTVGATDLLRSNQMRLNYVNLEKLATAWATPGSTHEGSSEVLDAVRTGLAHMHEQIYHPGTTWWGNWWSWNIGAAQPLANVMALIRDELDQADIDRYCVAFDHFLPERDPRLQQHPSGVQESNGANRVDICQAVIVRAVVQPDEPLLRAAVDALSPTWQYVTEGNGFFADGSFVQHSTIGYTGTYGLVLLGGLSKLFALLADSDFPIVDPTRSNLTGVIEGSFAPFMFNGQMMDAVRGRAVARYALRSKDNGDELIEHTLRLAKAADPDTAARWRGLCRQWIESNAAADIAESTKIGRRALVAELLDAKVVARPDATGPRFFPAMDRLVYRSTDGAWALCVAMCSNRIAWHEGTGAENMRGVKTSQGMTYLYLADDDTHFDDHFWATSDLDAPVGATVDLTPLPDNPEGQWGETTPSNEWTGGATLDEFAVSAMHLVAPGGTGLVARKAWFFQDDLVVALGSDISSRSGAEVRTVVEHRNLGGAPRTLTVDGEAITAPRTLRGARWAHLADVGGYVFLPGSPALRAEVVERQGRWTDNATRSVPETQQVRRRQYATLAYTHGPDATDASTYAYALLPGADAAQTAARAGDLGVRVLRNDSAVQAVRLPSGAICAAVWAGAAFDRVRISSSATLILKKIPTGLEVSLADPTQTQDALDVVLVGIAGDRVSGPDADRVSLTRVRSEVRLRVDTRGTAGRSLRFSVHRR